MLSTNFFSSGAKAFCTTASVLSRASLTNCSAWLRSLMEARNAL
jgi:hypothetical protein